MSTNQNNQDRYDSLRDGDVWITSKGEAVVVDQMHPAHAKNVLRLLQRLPNFSVEAPLVAALYERSGWNTVRVSVNVPLTLTPQDMADAVAAALVDGADPALVGALVSLSQAVTAIQE